MENNIIFECIIGSNAYGTNIETSDIDIKGVYQQDNNDILGNQYKQQIDLNKDTTYYEIKRFLELAATANPTILEMLFVDERFIKKTTPQFELVRKNKNIFLTKQCAYSFGGYAVAQIKKAKGLNKKMNWEKEKTVRKTPLDFCFVHFDGKSINVLDWLKQYNNCPQEAIGLSAIDRMPGCYSIYVDHALLYGKHLNKPIKPYGYRGIAFEASNDIRLSSIPKDQQCQGILYYNKDAYSIHCKEYNQYQTWLAERNTARYVDVVAANADNEQKIDSKNLMHCVRLLNTAIEIFEKGELNVFRPEREYLLGIRKGEFDLNTIIEESEKKLEYLNRLHAESTLPKEVDQKLIHELLIKIRNEF